jgi:hypothetical protein
MGCSRQPHTDAQRAELERLADRVRAILADLGVDPARPEAAARLPG